MDPKVFVSDQFGEVTKESGNKWAFWYFKPKPLPRDLNLDTETVLALSKADAALGRLSGVGKLVKDPSILVEPYLKREALASSRIEGTEASLSDVLQAEAGAEPTNEDDVQEVLNYQAALQHGIALLDSLPLSLRLVREVHEVLLSGVRGQEKLPGQFRSSPVWIGSTTESPDTATFVPPVPVDLPAALADWERFMNESSRLPVLIRCALMHYQFETIHPFLDGNGRVGRLLVILMLIEQKSLTLPLLYLSAYMEANRREYYDRLQAVREEGKVQEWLQYFLTAVERQSADAETRAEQLINLREQYRAELKGVRSRAGEVVELFFTNPYLTVRRVELALQITNQGARNLVEFLQNRGWLTRIGPIGKSGRVYWVAQEVYEAVQ